jgi:hypothetical protein
MEREIELEQGEHVIIQTIDGETIAVHWDDSIKTWIIAADMGRNVMVI